MNIHDRQNMHDKNIYLYDLIIYKYMIYNLHFLHNLNNIQEQDMYIMHNLNDIYPSRHAQPV